MFLVIFICVERICEMKDDDYENKRMILKSHIIAYCWTMAIRDSKTEKPESLPKLNMKPEGCHMLTVEAEDAF
jgi:hypothetical protein